MKHIRGIFLLGTLIAVAAVVAESVWKETKKKMDTTRNKPESGKESEPVIPPVALRIAGDTDPGKKRPNNEDTLFMDKECGVFGIFDGMGGMAAGEEASRIAKEAVAGFFHTRQRELSALTDATAVNALYLESFHRADTAIKAFAEEKGFHRIGTTAVVAVHLPTGLYLANLGDSRGYLVRKGEPLKRLTKDHTIAGVLVEIGEITEEEARDPGARNRLLASLGDMGQNKPYYSQIAPLQPGDRVVLCSDGLWDMLRDPEIGEITAQAATPEEAVSRLIARANEEGGTDNITVIVLFA